jgi:hypothetical protein
MSRFGTLVSSVTAPGSFHLAIRDLNARDKRFMFQFVGSGNFASRLYGTLAYDFDASTPLAPWIDITHRARRTDDAAAFADWVIVGSQYQRRKKNDADDPFFERGIYALDGDFFPAAIMFHVSSVSSGGHIGIHFGL